MILSLVGCSSLQPTYQVEVVPNQRPVLQQNLVSGCPDLPKLTKAYYSQAEVVDLLTEWINLYKQCQFKHQETVRFIQNYLNE